MERKLSQPPLPLLGEEGARATWRGKMGVLRPALALSGFCGPNHPYQMINCPLNILSHIIVPETNNLETQTRQIFRPPFIARRFRMLAAINFDNKLEFKTCEIREERANRHLATELYTKLLLADFFPQLLFSLGGFTSKSTRTFDGF